MTGIEIEQDIYDLVKASPLASLVNGQVCRKDTRPANSEAEDIIVAHVGGIDGQVQEGSVNVNCYVKDIDDGSGSLVEDISRGKVIARAMDALIRSAYIENYELTLDSVISTYKVQNANQHCVHMGVAYRRTTIND